MFKSNFDFLKQNWPLLSDLGEMAEKNLYQDSNTSLIKLRLFAEIIAKYMIAYENLSEPDQPTQSYRLKMLKREGFVPSEIINIFYTIKDTGNKATHEGYDSLADAKTMLSLAHKLAAWFMQVYHENGYNFEPEEFVLPPVYDPDNKIEELRGQLDNLTNSYENKVSKLEEQLDNLRSQQNEEEINTRRQNAGFHYNLNEAETRKIIDEQLRNAGWEVDTENIRYSKGSRPEKNNNKAIAEWPTKNGYADYALFVGLKLIAVVEAKKWNRDIVSDLGQAKDYAGDLVQKDKEEFICEYLADYKVPFIFSTNGREYIKQLENKSGIWFLDLRRPTNHPRPLQAWYTPDGLIKLLDTDLDEAHDRLEQESFDYLLDKRGLSLRDYQVEAIRSVEKVLKEEKREILLSMATGTGKTRTIIGLIYRLIKSKRFRRVLFLVDRTSLGKQTNDFFDEAVFENLDTFTKIYDLKGLDEKEPESHTKVHIATVQGMVRRILYNEEESEKPAVDTYDCIVVDEAHRGYILDKEMGDIELEFRDLKDYQSKYTKVIEYFDAVKIGLTATPALHTTTIFGKPVYEYSYREAVIDGYLVDHEPPHLIQTKLRMEGIKWEKGDVVPIYDPVTNTIINSDELPDELHLEVDKFNKMVITENFNRTVLEEIAQYIVPDGPEKTLIFAATDDHADLIVGLLKEIYENMGYPIDDDAIAKVTGYIKDPVQTIREYKNETFPTIAVTVDLLTTGIDVPEITNLVFLRTVKSRILYEQMLGRATRLCPEINKTHFNIYDAVGVYDTLEPVTNMKPVVVNPKVTFNQLRSELLNIEDEIKQKQHLDSLIAKMQRKKINLDEQEKKDFKQISGGKTPEEFIETLKELPLDEAIEEIKVRNQVVDFLDTYRYKPQQKFVSFHEDELLDHKIGYGENKKPKDYLDEFGEFINENINKIPALEIVCQRPKELTREALKELKLKLDKHGFSETKLNSAWREMKNEDIAADIISFIRQKALGDALISHEERIKNAVNKVKHIRNWTPIQLRWIERIEKQLLKESVIDKEVFDKGAFKKSGGYDNINKVLNGELDEVISVIKENLYNGRGTA